MDLLSRDEEQQLIERYQRAGDRRDEERLLRSQLPLVRKLARAHVHDGIEYPDLVQEGALGALQAIRRFDAARGVRLATYATWWIRAYQSRHVLRSCRQVRLGLSRAQRRVFFRIRGVRARLNAAGIEPTDDVMASMMGVSVDVARDAAARIDGREVPLDSAGDDAGDALHAVAPPADELAAARQAAALVAEARERYRATLSGRRRELFDARWLDEEAPTLQEMADRFGVSRERTRQLEQSMLAQLRRRLPSLVA